MSDFRFLEFDDLIAELDEYIFNQIHVHHTWKPTHRNFTGQNHIAMQQAMKDYHTRTLGWADIGQHLTLFPDGQWLTGRPFRQTPASISGWNTGSLAVEMVGNFDRPGEGQYNELGYDILEGKQKEEILKLIKYFIENYGEESIIFHNDNPNTNKTCPGTSLDKATIISQALEIEIDIDNGNPHWGQEHYDNLTQKGIIIHEQRYDDYITRAEAMALGDRITDWIIENFTSN